MLISFSSPMFSPSPRRGGCPLGGGPCGDGACGLGWPCGACCCTARGASGVSGVDTGCSGDATGSLDEPRGAGFWRLWFVVGMDSYWLLKVRPYRDEVERVIKCGDFCVYQYRG